MLIVEEYNDPFVDVKTVMEVVGIAVDDFFFFTFGGATFRLSANRYTGEICR